jgi:predicted phage tail protein
MLQQGVQSTTEQQQSPPVKGQQNGDDDGLLGGLKDIRPVPPPRGGKRDGIVQTAAKSAVRQVTNQIVRECWEACLAGGNVKTPPF